MSANSQYIPSAYNKKMRSRNSGSSNYMFTVEDKSPKKIQNYSVPTKKIVSTKDPKISQRHMSYYNNNNHVRKPRLVQEHEVNIVLNKLDQQFLKFFIFLVVVFVHQVNLCVYFKNTNKKT